MNGEDQNLDFLDALTIASFLLQLQNQTKIFGLREVQNDNNRIANEIHEDLEMQDEKINKILEVVSCENHQGIIRDDRGRNQRS